MAERKQPRQVAAIEPQRAMRLAGIDLLRGGAVAMMVAYHFCYDLAHFGFAPWSTNDMLLQGGWITWRNVIVSSFLTLVGVSLALRSTYKPTSRDFWKRWAQIAGAALLVSIASYFFAGDRWIYFGILHFIAVALVLGRLGLNLGQTTLPLCGLGLIAFGLLYSNAMFDTPPLNIIGLATHKPQTEDYVPLLPWFGVVLLGTALGKFLLARQRLPQFTIKAPPLRALALMGRWSLTIYLVHQPILMGLLEVIRAA